MMLPPEPDRWTIDLANAQRTEARLACLVLSGHTHVLYREL